MRQDLDDALCRDFPALYRDRHAHLSDSCMGFGFRVADGWEPVIRRLSKKLEPLVSGTDICASQVKEKFGELAFGLSGDTRSMKMGRAIATAMKEAARTCEACGKPGRIRTRRAWIQVLCDHCASSPDHVRGENEEEEVVETCLGCASMFRVPLKLKLRLTGHQARALETLVLIHGDKKLAKVPEGTFVDVSEHDIIGELVVREEKRLRRHRRARNQAARR
jgi:RNase P subunit RPR2